MKLNFAAALIGIILSGASALNALASSAPAHIQNLQGCFRVSYRFVEDGKHDYEVKDVLEWIALEKSPGHILSSTMDSSPVKSRRNSVRPGHCAGTDAGGRMWDLPGIHVFLTSGWDSCIVPHTTPPNPFVTEDGLITIS